eukprot:TRINITY_DN1199_c0_g2_i1.p3 TRINITY_DN1199_c0_g2~~TRINITY_DN1199_c0_g2_i1.p3  ORF type:complete len:133 (-),score=17.46 TRINITY_DN1199_c0_g2_i1:78-476(-)
MYAFAPSKTGLRPTRLPKFSIAANVRASAKGKTPMSKDAASRIQSNEAKQSGGKVSKGGFASRAQSAADRNANQAEKGGSSADKGSSGKGKQQAIYFGRQQQCCVLGEQYLHTDLAFCGILNVTQLVAAQFS